MRGWRWDWQDCPWEYKRILKILALILILWVNSYVKSLEWASEFTYTCIYFKNFGSSFSLFHQLVYCWKISQGSYASGQCQGNLNFFKVREFYDLSGKNEMSHSMTKPTKWRVSPAKTQISPVWSESSPSAHWVAKNPRFLPACASSEDSDEPGHPPRLIRVFAMRSLGN